jgi:very-short-patch-repair endonuclease
VVVHRARLDPVEVTIKDAIPVTSPSRTVIDLADLGRERPVERAIDEAAYLRLDLTGLEPRQGRRGAGVLRRVVASHDAGSTLTRSELEEGFLSLCRQRGLPSPQVNRLVHGYEVDFCWPEQKLIVETDGHAAHGTRSAFERDRVKDAELTAAGWRVVRVTYRRLTTDADALARQLGRFLR